MRHEEIDKSEINDYFSVIPTLMQLTNYNRFSDKSHDALLRCKECGIKHTIHELTRVSVGHFVCKFCLRKGA